MSDKVLNLGSALRDLEIAERAICEMVSAMQFAELHRAWQDFLIRIQRAWEYTERSLKHKPRFQDWFRPYSQQRGTDPLLVFLVQARNAETHVISSTLDKPWRLMIRDKLDRPFRLSSIKSSLEEGVLTIEVDTAEEDSLLTYEVAPQPTSPVLVRFCNRGRWYEPPASHLGNPLRSLHPVDVARLGLAFYAAFVKEAEWQFGSRAAVQKSGT